MGLVIGNGYEIQSELGAGGMGTVFLGLDRQTGQKIAIKALKKDMTHPDMLERFRREGQALSELNHPNIVKCLDALEHAGQHYLIMEYVAGGDLRQLLQRERLPYQRCLNIAIDLADALTRAHRLNIIHRDLKPANILIADDGTIRLTDFGVAHVVGKERVTDTDAIIGTLDYLAPEVLNGDALSSKADIWAFGLILFEMLAGKAPFAGTSPLQILNAIATSPIPDLEALAPNAPIALVDLVYRMLNRDPQARISSVRYVGAELEDILQDHDSRPITRRFETPIPDFRQRPKHNLPAQTTPFVGRESELAELSRLIQNPRIRLISIIAQGGMGKTRLSLEAAERQIEHFEQGVYFVELAPLNESSSIIPAIASALGYQFQSDGREPKQQIIDFLHAKELLLIFDNFEHLLDGASIVSDLLHAVPKLKILATSRQILDQNGEVLFHLAGMDFPQWETPADALDYAAVKLFMNSALRAKPDFELAADNLDAVARICKLVQGMPLGIVLAASWLGMLSPDEIAVELQKGLDFLETDSHAIPERQRSMRAVMDYSWQQMSEAEQLVFAKLSIFRGGFTREAAEAVTGANLRILLSLVNKSLLHRDSATGRYEIHELLRQYAEAKADLADINALQKSHSHYFLNWITQLEEDLQGRRQLGALQDIDKDYENLLLAWATASDNREVLLMNQAVDSCRFYFDFRARFQEVDQFFKQLPHEFVNSPDETLNFAYRRIRTRYIKLVAVGLGRQSDALIQELQDYLKLSESLNDIREVGFAYCQIAWQLNHRNERLAPLEKSIAHFRQVQDEFHLADVLDFYAVQLVESGEPQAADAYFEESIQLHRKIGNINGLFWALSNYAGHLFNKEEKIAGLKASEEAEKLALRINSRYAILGNKAFLMRYHFVSGNFLEAKSYIEQSYELATENHLDGSRVTALLYSIRMDCYYYEAYADALKKLEQEFGDKGFETDWVTATVIQFGLGNIAFVKAHLSRIIRKPTPNGNFVNLALAAFLLAREGYQEDAVRYLSLLRQQTPVQSGFVQAWPAVERHINQLKTALDSDLYKRLWEEGKALDWDSALEELARRFE